MREISCFRHTLYLSPYMNIMIDECAGGRKLREALDNLPSINVCSTFDCGYKQGQGDNVLVYKGTTKFNRILFTKNIGDINEVVYPPCGHGGIIVFHEQELTPDYVIPRIKALSTLRLAEKTKSHVTKIYDDRIEVHTLEGKIERKFDEHEKTRKISKGK